MATINVYSPFNDLSPEGNSRVCVSYERETVTVSVQRAKPDTLTDGHPTYEAGAGPISDMDRAGCNNLIRAVREARDRAFGKDE